MIGSIVASGVAFAQRPAAPQPAGAQPRNQLQQVPLQVQNLPPELEQILHNWSRSTQQIKELHGEHKRFVYDLVFETENWSTGAFYYRAPDMGRIDLEPFKYRSTHVGNMKDKAGQPFKLVPAQPEKWICTGQRIMQVNEQEKQVDVYPIPLANQGENIMNGPLPFLFGMPPALAKQRYHLALLPKDNPQTCTIEARPRWKSDAEQYQKAFILLDKRTWLPIAVKLIDPAGTKETVYEFLNLEQPKEGGFGAGIWKAIFGDEDPFFVDPRKYKFVNKEVTLPENPQRQGDPRRTADPRDQQRQGALPREGQPGQPPVRVVGGEQPGSASLDDGSAVAPGTPGRPATPAPRPAAGRQFALPSFQGMSHDQVKATVEQYGLSPIYQPGDVAPTSRHTWTIYAQSPPAGTVLTEGAKVKLVYYNERPAATP
ncbi:MAG: PASTA domain-containing protein [Planctomycetaceae bacterium]